MCIRDSDGDLLQPVVLLHHLEHAEAVEAGHVDVEQQVDVELGVQQIEHYKTNIPRDEDGINNSVYQEEPAMFLLKPHTRGYRERKDRTGFADKSLEKMAQRESYLRQAQKQKEVVLRYIREQKIRFAEIDEVVSEDTRAIFLQWIAQANMSSEKTGRTEYGQEYQLKRKDGSCVLKCEDGDLKMPDYTLEFK